MKSDKKSHWEKIYKTKTPNDVSWTQEKPGTSLDFVQAFELPKEAKIIDIGGGDSKLVDYLLTEGYQNISVLDISEAALERAKKRLGTQADLVNWIVSDVTDFSPNTTYDLWHDRATFHFLTSKEAIAAYTKLVEKVVSKGMIIGTFSENGPEKCSGLPISQYTDETLSKQFEKSFHKIKCLYENHTTPFHTLQNFVFCSFKKSLG